MTSGLLYADHPKRDYYRYMFWVIPEEIYNMNGQKTLINEAWSPQFEHYAPVQEHHECGSDECEDYGD